MRNETTDIIAGDRNVARVNNAEIIFITELAIPANDGLSLCNHGMKGICTHVLDFSVTFAMNSKTLRTLTGFDAPK